jgi:GDPmannose 4,6-dehydratase
MKKALITGIAGQDGSYLSELLLKKGYNVYGLVLHSESLSLIKPIKDKLTLIEGTLLDQESLDNAIRIADPDEVYHLAALSFVGVSWNRPVLTGDVNALGTTRLLESLRRIKPNAKFYHASTSEMFGLTEEIRTEEALFHPRNPYAISKCFSHWIAINYRESYNMFICCGIMFNHESPRRGNDFVTKKIARNVAKIKRGQLDHFYLGNLDTKRDWGYAKEYVNVMWEAFLVAGIEVVSNGKHGIEEEYIRKDNGKAVVKISPKFFRTVELTVLRGSNNKAREKLAWKPQVKFKELVTIMVEHEQNAYSDDRKYMESLDK